MYRTSKNKMIRRIGLSSVAAATALGLGITVANASTTHSTGTKTVALKALNGHKLAAKYGEAGDQDGLQVRGVITALTSTTVTITDRNGTATTYTLASGITVTKEHAAASVSDLAIGQQVEATLSAVGSTTVSALDIDVARLGGQVTAVTGSTITVTNPHGTATINISGATTYTLNGAAATASDVTVGTYVLALGDATSTPTNFNAVSVAISTTAPAFGRGDNDGDHAGGMHEGMGPVVGGQVTAVSGSTITVTDPRGNTDVITVDASTMYSYNGGAGNLAEVVVGSFVFAQGTSTGPNTFTASSVAISSTAPVMGQHGDGDGMGQGNHFGDD